jgi:hypothetical protein
MQIPSNGTSFSHYHVFNLQFAPHYIFELFLQLYWTMTGFVCVVTKLPSGFLFHALTHGLHNIRMQIAVTCMHPINYAVAAFPLFL